jgi:hypothetical protein
LFAVLPDYGNRGLQANTDAAPVVDESALGGNASDHVFGGQSRGIGWRVIGHDY